jgi:hypothetical protein
MQERTRLLSGRLSIVDKPDRSGIEIRVSIPLDAPGNTPPVAPSTHTLQ